MEQISDAPDSRGDNEIEVLIAKFMKITVFRDVKPLQLYFTLWYYHQSTQRHVTEECSSLAGRQSFSVCGRGRSKFRLCMNQGTEIKHLKYLVTEFPRVRV